MDILGAVKQNISVSEMAQSVACSSVLEDILETFGSSINCWSDYVSLYSSVIDFWSRVTLGAPYNIIINGDIRLTETKTSLESFMFIMQVLRPRQNMILCFEYSVYKFKQF